MKSLKFITAAVLFVMVTGGNAYAQTEPTCESMGYTMTEAQCTLKGKAALKCPFDNSKVYCGLNACDMVAAVTCTSGCKQYYSTCPTKCQICYSTACKDKYNRLNYNYSLVMRKAQNCGNAVSWSRIMPIKVNETCDTFKTRVTDEVVQYNKECSCDVLNANECAPKITYSPSKIRCQVCCAPTGEESELMGHNYERICSEEEMNDSDGLNDGLNMEI